MSRGRLEAFSDGVIAILMTIMVFDIKPPVGTDVAALWSTLPILLTYLMSFLYLGIYWNNHHHMFALVQRVNGNVLWANLHLLFWLSLLPFATNWLRSSDFQPLPTALYGMVLLLEAAAFLILQEILVHAQHSDTRLKNAIGQDWKGKCSALLYVVGIGAAFVDTRISLMFYTVVALIWLIPDRRMEACFIEEGP